MADQVGREALEPPGACDELVLGREAPRQGTLLLLVELGLLEDVGELLAEALVDDLQLGDPVLVEQRNRRPVLDRVEEGVGRDVSPKTSRVRCSSPAINGVPVKPRKLALGSARRMFSASVEYWVRWASSVMTMMSSRAEQTGMASSGAVRNLWIKVNT